MPEINIKQHIVYWRDGALESMDDASYLIKGGRISLGLFCIHLALEKTIKAHVCKQINGVPPKIHNLLALAKLANLTLDPNQERLFALLNTFQAQGRYPDILPQSPSLEQIKPIFDQAKEVQSWLMKQL